VLRIIDAPAIVLAIPPIPEPIGSMSIQFDAERLIAAGQIARTQLLDERCPNGHWIGELSSSPLATATAISALVLAEQHGGSGVLPAYTPEGNIPFADRIYQGDLSEQIVESVHWLARQQNEDGGWGDTTHPERTGQEEADSYYRNHIPNVSNIATTMLVQSAFHLTGVQVKYTNLLERAKQYVQKQGGVFGLKRRYGNDKTFAVPILTNCALASILPWRQVPALPFELACLPQSWYRSMNLSVVSYAIPALVAMGQARHHHAPSRNPVVRFIRQSTRKRSLAILKDLQPESGGFLEATPLTAFVVMSLSSIGLAEHVVVRKGVEFLLASVRADGSWPIDTNLAVWNSAQAATALQWDFAQGEPTPTEFSLAETMRPQGQHFVAEPPTGELTGELTDELTTADAEISTDLEPTDLGQITSHHADSHHSGSHNKRASEDQLKALDWLLKCQHHQTHPYTGAKPGGWAWTDLSGGVPDADDTSAMLLALASWRNRFGSLRKQSIEPAARAGIGWLLDQQNQDGGWPTFCRGWGKLPFDRSSTDITAHALRAMHAWRNIWQLEQTDLELHQQFADSTHAGLQFLESKQCEDGSWIPLWFGNQRHPQEWNCVYGTAKVLLMCHELGIHQSNMTRRGISWLTDAQLACGGWGFACDDGDFACSVEETALAVEALIALHNQLGEPEDQVKFALEKGVNWLTEAILAGRHHEPSPIGFYFAKLWYHERLYPHIFSVQAISRAAMSDGLFKGNPQNGRIQNGAIQDELVLMTKGRTQLGG
jgi:squalene-hopene/tetraprenyl-beta-curcumene cyclase